MQIKVGLENNAGGRSLAWAQDFPGCFSYGKDASEALVSLAPSFLLYKSWIARHTAESWLADVRDVDVHLSEVFEVYQIDTDFDTVAAGGVSIHSWFRHDWRPLTRLEVKRGLQVLSFARADLLDLAFNLPDETLNRTYPDERWSIRGILQHVAGVEWYYLDCLGQAGFTRRELPEDPFECLGMVRRRTLEVLSAAEGATQVVGVGGEFWSPRKLLRRVAWHELDHLQHIQRLSQINV
jgi:hypothetical protein